MDCASATCSALTVLTPTCLIRPSCRISSSAPTCSATDPGSGASKPPSRALTTSSAAMPRVRRFPAARWGGRPAAGGGPFCSAFGHDHQVAGVGVQGLLDDLVGDVRPIEVAGVNVV